MKIYIHNKLHHNNINIQNHFDLLLLSFRIFFLFHTYLVISIKCEYIWNENIEINFIT